MPILDVELVCAEEPAALAQTAKALADEVGRVLSSRPGGTWVKIHLLPVERYAENGASPDDDGLPAFVRILQREPPRGDALEAEVAALTATIARVLNRPVDRVHLEYLPAALGRQSFGGRLVK